MTHYARIISTCTFMLACALSCNKSAPEEATAAPAAEAAATTTVQTQTVRAACGSCIFHMEGGEGCYWAVELDGKYYATKGDALPEEHDSHGPAGMCTVERKATVSGSLVDGEFVATQFDLAPFEAKAKTPDKKAPAPH